MSTESHYRKMENMFHLANVNAQLFEGVKLTVGHKEATLTLPIQPTYFHAMGAIHGAVYFKLLDDAAYFAANSIVEDAFLVTTSFHLNLLRPVMGGTLKAIGKVTFASKQLFVAEATVYNEKGKEVAKGTGNFMKSRFKISDIDAFLAAKKNG